MWAFPELFHPASLQPVLAVIGLVEPTDDDSPGGTGMDEPPLLQIDAYMRGSAAVASVVEEDQVAFLQVLPADFLTIVFALCLRIGL